MAKIRKHNKKDNCLYCGDEFSHYKWDKQLYCSKECYYKIYKVKSNCETCGKETLKSKSTFERNEGNYCSRDCYNNRRKENLKRLKRSTSYFTLLVQKGCECGVTEYYLLQIHHKDGNNENNEKNNLEVVCANCHIKRHLKLTKNGKLVYHPKTLTSIKILKLIT